jgi:predicted RNase H-like HicB family nuclease
VNLRPKFFVSVNCVSPKAFIAEVPELSGCMADGATYQEALANAEVIIQEWIETARELGRPIPQPKGRLVYA